MSRRGGSRVLLDPVLRALAGLEGLDEGLAPRANLVHSELATRDFPNLVSHFCFPPSLDGLIIAGLSGFVNTFLKIFSKKFFKKTVDILPDLYYNITIKREEQKKMYESDKVVGTDIREAIKWIDAKDLWDEVVEIEADGTGIVTAVVH